MFVFKAAVVGTGELADEIAGAIAAAGVELVRVRRGCPMTASATSTS